MHRCFVRPEDWDNDAVRLRPDVAHHLYRVYRAREGDEVAVFDGRGREGIARVGAVPAGKMRAPCVLTLLRQSRAQPLPARIALIQALPKGKRMDWIVEKAVELGIAEILPVLTERVVTRLDSDRRAERASRWQRIAEGAARQCGTAWLPEVAPPVPLEARLAEAGRFDLFLAGSLDRAARPLRGVLRESLAARPGSVAVLIGPEGDLTPEESRAAVAAGAIPVCFGPLTMRLETAALYAMSVVVYEFRGVELEERSPAAGP